MLQLPNNCRAGKFSVRPANWKSQSAKVNVLWKIQYWFYDDNLKTRKLVPIAGMNRLETLKEKQELTQSLINDEIDLLQTQGYNYITKTYSEPEACGEVNPATPVTEALRYAYGALTVERKSDIKSAMTYIGQAIKHLHYDRLAVGAVRRRHIKKILDTCSQGKTKFGPSSYNHYRSYIRMLFKELLIIEAVEANPVNDLPKKKETRMIRLELTKAERKILRDNLPKTSPRFWIFSNIFFHSGSRETEMVSLKLPDIDLENQRFKVLVKKGKSGREEWRPIKDIALPYWEQAIEGAKETDYIFSKGLKPGPTKIRVDQITKRFYRLKKKFGIKADFYSFKHSNLDEMAAAMAKHKEAMDKTAEMAGHIGGTVITMRYTQGETARRFDTQKAVRNEL